MKDLFKKKQSTKQPTDAKPKASKGAKSGFSLSLGGKKVPKTDNAKPKKAGFGFGKKSVPEPVVMEDDATSAPTTIKTKAKSKPKSSKALDVNKLIMILGGLLAVVVIGLGLKLFVFNEEPAPPPPPPAVTETPPAPVPPPADTVPTDPAMGVPPVDAAGAVPPVDGSAQDVPTDPALAQVPPPAPVVADSQPALPTESTVPPAPTAPPATATPSVTPTPPPSAKISQEEFLKESDRRIYRERNTGVATGQ